MSSLSADVLHGAGHEVLVLGAAGLFALTGSKIAQRTALPVPAILLLLAAIASDAFDGLTTLFSPADVVRTATIALIPVLFSGGVEMGLRTFRRSAGPILALGLAGTAATAAILAVAIHLIVGLSWLPAAILGVAIAPTDPAVMFSVLAGREIEGDSAAILKGEAGANDPVGIAVLLALVGVAASGHGSVWTALGSVGMELGIGSVVGVGGGFALVWIARNVSLPEHGLYPLRTLAGALVIFGGAAALHGSGFIAVFIAGMIVGDAKLPHEAEIRSFHEAVSQLGEIAVFVPLGLTITLSSFLDARQVLEGVALALILAVVARPVPTVLLLLPSSLAANERYLIAWAGLKGAVPIMLATLPVVDGIDHADAIFHLAVIVVLVSVTLQAASIPWVAARLGLPLRTIDR